MSTENHRMLLIQPMSKEVEQLYRHHGTFHEGDSGLDLFIVEDATIKAGETAFLKLGIKCAAYNEHGQNVSWLVLPRSSISKTPLRLANSVGLIDAGYRGEIIACLDNIRSVDYSVKRGDRLLQAVYYDLGSFSLKIVDELSKTSRGEKGFGSTTAASVVQSLPSETESSTFPGDDGVGVSGEMVTRPEETKKSDVDFENQAAQVQASDIDSENQAPQAQASETRKRSSDTELDNQCGLVKKARSDMHSS